MAHRIAAGTIVTMLAVAWMGMTPTPAAGQVPPFNQCPPVGSDTSCEILIVAGPGGTFVVLFDPTQPGFAGDDTLVGVQNDSSQTITAFSISSVTDIFGFDVDGLCDTFGAPAGCPFGPTGYEGPGVSFNVASSFAGTVHFSPGIPPGGSAFFSLEEDVHTLAVGVCGDGILQPGELCDDGAANGTSTSCCTTSCTGQCDDRNACTDDACSSTSGAFVCSHGAHVCDDGNPCTDDLCDSASGCFTSFNASPCNDFNPCTDNDRCTFGVCQGTSNTAPCNDGNACTTNDRCSFGSCIGGTPVDCNDHNPCTSEFCDFFLGCRYTNLDGIKCDDHNPCTTDDACAAGRCTGDVRNCFDDDPCTVDTCNSAGGAFLCQHENCNSIPSSSCPAQCKPPQCGNGRLDPGETCDPPDPTLDPQRPGEAKCRADCTFCGDGQVQAGHGETCDDGNLLSGCTPSRPNIPLDACQNACTAPICHDPSNIKLTAGKGAFTMHGRITPVAPDTAIDPRDKTFVVELTDANGVVLFRSSLDAGAIQQKGVTFAYANPTALQDGGFSKLKIVQHAGAYLVTLRTYGDLSGATDRMTTHLFIDAQEWTLAGHWLQTSHGWRLDTSSTFGG